MYYWHTKKKKSTHLFKISTRFKFGVNATMTHVSFLFFFWLMQSGGGRYNVETGRKDGFVSLATNVNLPGPDIPVAQSVATFAKKGLNATDMVYLLGIYTPHLPPRYIFKHYFDTWS